MMTDLKTRIIEMTARDLELVEAALEERLCPNLELVREIAGHLLFSGGKRLRPLLMIHGARLCGYRGGFEIGFSTIFEYLHAATLLHDDVVDQSEIRRGRPAAHTRWSAPKVVLTGDFLLARALGIAAETGQPEIIAIIAEITREMAQGEIDQLDQKGNPDLSEAQYLDIIARKTAVLIQGACQSGAVLAGASFKARQALRRYGYHTGMAFQMADDLLDYTGTRETLGKHPGADMREGKLTLPMIYSLSRADARDRSWMVKALQETVFDPERFETLKMKMDRYGGIEYTRRCAREHVQKAVECMGEFSEGPSRELLTMIAAYSIERKG